MYCMKGGKVYRQTGLDFPTKFEGELTESKKLLLDFYFISCLFFI